MLLRPRLRARWVGRIPATLAEVPIASWEGEAMGGYRGGGSPTTERASIDATRVSSLGHDRTQLAMRATRVNQAIGADSVTVLADRRCFKCGAILTDLPVAHGRQGGRGTRSLRFRCRRR